MADLGSQLLGVRTPRKSPSGLSSRRSNVSLRQSGSLAQDLGGAESDGAQRFTLAHELAAALLPEPASSSRSLANEFGIEFDDDDEEQEAERIEVPHPTENGDIGFKEQHDVAEETLPTSFADDQLSSAIDDTFEQPTFARRKSPPVPAVFEEDPLLVLNQSLKSTDLFLKQLRKLDTDSTSSTHNTPPLEQLAADIIRRIDETTREREEQVRELLGYDREFRKIAAEIGGNDLLGDLDALEHIDGLVDETLTSQELTVDDTSLNRHRRSRSSAWQDAPDPHSLDILMEEEEEDYGYRSEEPITPQRDQFLPASPPSTGPPTPSNTIPQLAYMRTITQSLVVTLGTISEQAQVNAAATADAGRKIRALKNRMGTLRSEWDSAERSRIRVENWEAGIWEEEGEQRPVGSDSPTEDLPSSAAPPKPSGKRIDARKIVEEELKGFSLALEQAGAKTKAIMASS